MTESGGAAIVARARSLVGVRFRAQGRSAATGLDCIGLVAEALGLSSPPADYRLRAGSAPELESGLAAAGLRRARTDAAEGDVLVMQPAPHQLHLGIWTGGGIVHADARLRRVVERPGEPPWPVIGIWTGER